MPSKPVIVVLCTGNSCRSQMAAAYLRTLSGDRFSVRSAGTEPSPAVHPLAVRVLAEDGLDISAEKPTDYRALLGAARVRYLITVCDGAAETCPAVWPGVRERLHWPFEDPASFRGTRDETTGKFREVRDLIRARVRSWLGELEHRHS